MLQARKSLDQSSKPPTDDKRLQAGESVNSATDKASTAADETKRSVARAQADVDTRAAATAQARSGVQAARDTLDKATRESGDSSALDQARAAAVEATNAAAEAHAAIDDAGRAVADAKATVPDAQRGVDDAKAELADAKATVPDAQQAVDDAKAELADAKAAVTDAQQAVTDANTKKANALSSTTTVASGGSTLNVTATLPESNVIATTVRAPDIEALDSAIRQAQAGVRSAEARVRQAETGVRTAEATVANRQRTIDDAARNVTKAQNAATRADNQVTQANASVKKAESAIADRTPQLRDLSNKVTQAETEVGQADTQLQLARQALTAAKRGGTSTERSASAQAAIAQAQQRELLKPADVALLREQLDSAIRSRQRADDELTKLERKIGIVVPANELLFFPSLPLRVDDTKLNRGDLVNGSVMTVTTSRLAVDSSLDVADAKLVSVNAKATIEASDFDVTLQGRITEIASTPGTKGVDTSKVYMEIVPETTASSAATTQQLNGTSVKLTIPVKSTGGEVLAVPVAALSVAADGTSRVEVEDAPDKPTRYVTVNPGLAAEGMVAVTPVKGPLTEGAQVVVGSKGATDLQGDTGPNDRGAGGG